jgi:hypothetical protein
VVADTVRDLRRVVDLIRVVDSPDAADLAAKAGALGATPNPPAVAELWPRVRASWRGGLTNLYHKGDPTRQALIGWAVDPDDVPAYPRRELTVPPNPEAPRTRAAEKAFSDWQADARYGGEAAALRGVDTPAARAHVAALDALAREFQHWTP